MWLLDFRPIDFQMQLKLSLWKLILENEKYYFNYSGADWFTTLCQEPKNNF
jgi:outer membrane phospholipase A